MTKHRLLIHSSALASTVLFAAPAIANDDTAKPAATEAAAPARGEAAAGEIVVTAQKRAESLSKVPQSITALSSAALATKGIVSLNDLGRQTPGLTMTERQNHIPNVTLRGIGSFGFVKGVGFYVDDVPNYTDQTMRLEDLDRIEIIKGPQGTLFGGNAVGGAIRYISKKPSFTQSAELKTDIGTHDYENVYASVNVPLSDDKVALRASGYINHDGGFIHDDGLNVQTARNREFGLRAQLLAKPTDNFTALITVRNRDFDGGAFSYALQNSVTTNNYTTNLTFRPENKIKTFSATADFTYDLGSVSLTSITSFTRQTIFQRTDNDYTPAAKVMAVVNSIPTKVYTQELRLTSETHGPFDWIFGLYGARLENVALNPTPLVLTVGAKIFSPYNLYTTRQIDLAAFGTGNYHIGDFTLSGGLRLNKTSYEANAQFISGAVANGETFNRDTTPLPKASLSYRTDGGQLLYASVARGYESGKIDVSGIPTQTFAPETNWTYELGTKGSLGHGVVYYELSAFYIKAHNRQAEIFTVDSLGVGKKRVGSIGDATSKGVEATLSWRPVTGLSLDGSAGYLDAKWDTGSYGGKALKGLQVPNAPNWTANLGATYSTPLSEHLKLDMHVDAAYKDSFEWSLNYTPFSNTNPSYWLAAARIAIGDPDGKWQLSGRVDNLFDKGYFTEFIPNYAGPQLADGTCVKCHLGALGDRRRFVLSLDTKF